MESLRSEFDQVLDSFHLEQVGDNLFQSRSPVVGWRRIYGGLLLAHAVRAAELALGKARCFHSLHGSFLRPGNVEEVLRIQVENLLDGRTVAHRRITMAQSGKPVFVASISFRNTSGGLFHAPDMPRATSPEDLMDETALCEEFAGQLPGNAEAYLKRRKVFELRPVDPLRFVLAEGDPETPMLLWVRLREPSFSGRQFDSALLAYLSDMAVLNASLKPHGRNFFDPGLSMASLDHALWQHADPDWKDWLLITHDSLATEAQMGLGQTRIFNRAGGLVATVAQQGFIRTAIA